MCEKTALWVHITAQLPVGAYILPSAQWYFMHRQKKAVLEMKIDFYMNLYFSKVIFYTIITKNRVCPKDHSKINVKGTYVYRL